MKRLLIALALAVMSKAAEPSTDDLIAKVRSVVSAPDHWVDISAELRELEVLADHCGEKNKGALITFRDGLADYRTYFAEHPFTLSSGERRSLTAAIRSYEAKITQERDRILALWQKHPDQDHGCLDAATRALTVADNELEKLSAILAPHSSRIDRPNELAAAVIGVVRRYGLFLALASSSVPGEATHLGGTTTASGEESRKWRQAIEAELTESYALVAVAGYNVSSGQISVPATPKLADALCTGPQAEVVAFLETLKADEAHREQLDYISKCLEAIKGGGKPTKSHWKFADGREVDVANFHIPLLIMATNGNPSVAKDQETITLSPFVDTFDWRPYHLSKATPDSADGHFHLIAVSRAGDVTLRDLTSSESIRIRHDQTAKKISDRGRSMRLTGFDFESQTADFEWFTTK